MSGRRPLAKTNEFNSQPLHQLFVCFPIKLNEQFTPLRRTQSCSRFFVRGMFVENTPLRGMLYYIAEAL